jgi:protein tyrosine/serine phosphatase
MILKKTLFLLPLLLIACCSDQEKESTKPKRPASWAVPMEVKGLPNLHKVTDTLYRGAQPTKEGMKNLEEMGIKTVLNLRSFHSDRDELEGTNLNYEHLTMKAWHPEDKELVHFLKLMNDKKHTPLFVHCQHGADRTGTLCAVYRIVFCGWTKEKALEEMTEGGFGFHGIWENLLTYVRELDIRELKKKAGIK